MIIREGKHQDLGALAELGALLWPEHTVSELEGDFAGIMGPEAAFFLALEDEKPMGFAQCQLRHDYVEGTDSSPVGYLEGIYVAEDCRGKGVAKELLEACEAWARGKGCREFASDCELDNTQSLRFHQRVGFQEANRIICFTKQL